MQSEVSSIQYLISSFRGIITNTLDLQHDYLMQSSKIAKDGNNKNWNYQCIRQGQPR